MKKHGGAIVFVVILMVVGFFFFKDELHIDKKSVCGKVGGPGFRGGGDGGRDDGFHRL